MPGDIPLDLHQWISFDDRTEQRTWVFDATFLRSDWRCIYGNGCRGVLDADATEAMQGCCSYGAHLVDEADVVAVVAAAARLTAAQWQFRRRARTSKGFLTTDTGETTTRLVDGACIFLNRPGFAGGVGCALHVGAVEAGERPMDWKPDVCWQLPLRLDNATDDHGHVTSTLREWKRRDWGPGGADFHWWCTEAAEAFRAVEPVYITMRAEIVELIGAAVYEELRTQLGGLDATPLPHPAVRRR